MSLSESTKIEDVFQYRNEDTVTHYRDTWKK